MDLMERRQFLRLLATGGAAISLPGLLAACGGDDAPIATTGAPATTASTTTTAAPVVIQATTTVDLALSYLKTVEFAGYYLAIENGFYDEEGIALQLFPGGPNAPASEQQVASGNTNFGSVPTESLASAVKAGSDLVGIGAQLQSNMSAFMSLPSNPVRTMEDLVGKRIGSGKAFEEIYRELFRTHGLPTGPDEFIYVPVGRDPTPLLEGQVDVFAGFMSNQALTIEEITGEPAVLLKQQDFGLPLYTGNITVRRSFLEENRDLVVSFLRGTIKGFELNLRDPVPGAVLTTEKYGADLGMTLAKETRANEIYIEASQSDLTREKGLFWVDLDFIRGPIYEGLKFFGLEDLPDPSTYWDLSVLEEIYGDTNHLL